MKVIHLNLKFGITQKNIVPFVKLTRQYQKNTSKFQLLIINDIQNLNFPLLDNLRWFGAIAQFEQMRVLRP